MRRRHRMRMYQRRFGAGLAVSGVLVWAISAALHFGLGGHRDVSIAHFEARSLGVIAGGASVAGGVILLATAV
jgi:hypothetical protein